MRIPKAFLASTLLAALSSSMWAQGNTPAANPGTTSAPVPQHGPTNVEKDNRIDGWLPPGEDPNNKLVLPFLKHIASDQEQFWTSPAHFRVKDLKWIIPFTGATAGLIAGDSWISKQIPNKPNQLNRSLNISDYSTYALIGVGGGSFLLGQMTHNDHLSETGLLSGEAAINATGLTYLIKGLTQRQRPNLGTGDGKFFQGGQSFTSEHSAIAWSIASVWAHEYPSTLSQILAYGLASAVTVTRVTSQQHFASDVFVGSALGWYFGRQVYRAHHDPELGGTSWDNLLPDDTGEKTRNPKNMGSPYVPLDSWIYPAIERLQALGYINSAYLGMRPWTRMECARLMEEAEDRLTDDNVEENDQAAKLYSELQTEFQPETGRLGGAANLGASLDSIYTRVTGISGKPLRDGYHFGQTIINDYGRPYGEGFNNVTGFTSHAVAGPLSISIQGEYQHAPAVASDPPSVLQTTASADSTLPLPNGTSQIDRFRLLESTIGLTFGNVQFSFGKQSLWLGPAETGAFLFTNNADPMTMFRIDSVAPYEIPLISKLLGPVRSEFFLGQLSGQHWEFSPVLFGPDLASQPYIHGTKFSFHPTVDLEIGIGFTAQFGGPGNPFTWHNFLRTFYSHKTSVGANPGKRLSAFNFSYRIPGLRDWLQIYCDSMVIDEYSPLVSNRPSINPGIYLSHLPGIPKMDLRLEGVTSDLNVPAHFGAGAVYWDERYHSGYTNDGNLIGEWIGRRGRGEQGWATYWFSPRRKIQLGYRHNNVDKAFLNGGSFQDFNLGTDMLLGTSLSISGSIQYEEWQFPILAPSRKSDTTASVQITWWPGRSLVAGRKPAN